MLKLSKVRERNHHSGATKKPGRGVAQTRSSLDIILEAYAQVFSPENGCGPQDGLAAKDQSQIFEVEVQMQTRAVLLQALTWASG